MLTRVSFYVIFLLTISLDSRSQELAPYIRASHTLHTTFHIQKVIDSTYSSFDPSTHYSKFTSDTYQALNTFFERRFAQSSTTEPLIAVIHTFNVLKSSESQTKGKGILRLVFNFYTLYDDDTTLLYRGVGGGEFSLGSRRKETEDIGKFCNQVLHSVSLRLKDVIEKQELVAFNKGSKLEILPFKKGYIPDTIFYHRGPISWKHFEGLPRAESHFTASIFSSFGFKTNFRMSEGFIQASLTPYVYMLPNMSWVRKGEESAYALAHEQLHFDIAYMSCLGMLQTISKYQTRSLKDLQSKIQYEYIQAYRKMHQYQSQYDIETDHGSRPFQQAKWYTKVKGEIENLRATYRSP